MIISILGGSDGGIGALLDKDEELDDAEVAEEAELEEAVDNAGVDETDVEEAELEEGEESEDEEVDWVLSLLCLRSSMILSMFGP